MKTNNIVPTIKTLILALILAAGVSYISAWTGPTGTAPANNVAAPVNVSLSHQEKLGNLYINTDLSNPFTIGLKVFGQSIFNGPVQLNVGSSSANKVLVSTDTNGTVAWVSTSTLGFGGASSGSGVPSTIQTFTTPGTTNWAVPAGVTRVRVKAWGAGGGGANNARGAGGSGGYSESVVSVTPGTPITVTIGAGGSSNTNTKAGDSSFGTLVKAIGGYSTNNINGGLGGGTFEAIGDFKIEGGDGQDGVFYTSGGTNAVTYGGTGASAPMGGQGGQPAGGNGSVPGGAGSGGTYTTGSQGSFTVGNGGNGANGAVVVEY